jgi:micrococcal nuclease
MDNILPYNYLIYINKCMYEYKAQVVKVVDGDTVDVDIDLGFNVWLKKQRIRLYGIDTPESRTSDKVEKVFGNLAKSKVLEFCPIGSNIILQTKTDDSRGKYGRILGELVTLDGTNVNTYLIENSYGVAYFGKSKDDIAEEQLKNRDILIERGEVTL